MYEKKSIYIFKIITIVVLILYFGWTLISDLVTSLINNDSFFKPFESMLAVLGFVVVMIGCLKISKTAKLKQKSEIEYLSEEDIPEDHYQKIEKTAESLDNYDNIIEVISKTVLLVVWFGLLLVINYYAFKFWAVDKKIFVFSIFLWVITILLMTRKKNEK